MSETTSTTTTVPDPEKEVVPTVAEPLNENISRIMMIYASLEESQKVKGGLSLQDCRNLVNARATLLSLFSTEDDKVARDKEFQAFDVLTACCQVQQSLGVFKIEGSVRILETLEAISAALDKLKSPERKAKDVNEKFKNLRTGPTGGNQNRNRGGKK